MKCVPEVLGVLPGSTSWSRRDAGKHNKASAPCQSELFFLFDKACGFHVCVQCGVAD
jgi:hypothetical protein